MLWAIMKVASVSGNAVCASRPVVSAFWYCVVCGMRVKVWCFEMVATPPVCCFVVGSRGLSKACCFCVKQSALKVAACDGLSECSCICRWSAGEWRMVFICVCALVELADWMM
jgi:hypothetical protein